MTLQGHLRSLILAPIESAYMTSYSTSIVTLVVGPIYLAAFQRYYSFCTPKATFQHPTPIRAKISGCSPWSKPVMFGL